MNSARANIQFLTRKFEHQKIAIIGLGGTGSYILDQVAKTPVKEIHLYDGDTFCVHNAFRSPGAIPADKMNTVDGLKKATYFFEVYSQMHMNIIPHDIYVTSTNIKELIGFDYVFISIDNDEVRIFICKWLKDQKIQFIDVGMGLNKVDDCLIGALRVTTVTGMKNDHLTNRIGSMDSANNEYSPNIQISDLNCLNAMLAIIKWKKLCGFYQDLKNEHNTLFFLNTNTILNEDNQT
jgi:tRNA A37 threonylcarbamoyladenosine dehydratase